MEESAFGRLRQTIARVTAMISALLWAVSLCLPYNTSTLTFLPPHNDQHDVPHSAGLVLIALGWCLPLCLNIAWWANPMLLRGLWNLLRRGQPGFSGSLYAMVIGATIYGPVALLDAPNGRFNGAWMTGPAINVWFAALLVNVFSQLVCPVPVPAYLRFKIG